MCRKWGLIFLFYLFLQPLLHGQAGYVLNESFDQKPLSDIFLLLEKKFRVKFAYDEEVVTPVMISRHVQARELREALEQLFSGTDLVFQIPAPGQVLVRKEYLAPKETVSFLEINGRVTDNWSGASPSLCACAVFRIRRRSYRRKRPLPLPGSHKRGGTGKYSGSVYWLSVPQIGP
ncbi:MAG: STN domain-containing protein [Haliscomenobacter sp.]|nr:STN domain-containing protein [Haliscomenobacter sp.]